MAIGTDLSINTAHEIRHVSGTTVYSMLDLHKWLQELADDALFSGNDELDILSKNPSKLDGPRSAIKPMLLNLLNTFNIDDEAAKFFNFGSVQQNGTDDLFTGVKSIGSPLVPNSPIYIVQDGNKLTSFWADGHIQILVKAKSGGTLIDNGNIRAYSRKYGQTYADFAGNLIAGGEQSVALSTSLTDWTPLDEAAAAALSSKVTIVVGSFSKDTGDGNGSKTYKGRITLSGGISTAEAAQYMQYICRQDSTTVINGDLGWKYRVLDATYTPNGAAPFGAVAGGKWFVAQGWDLEGVLASDKPKIQLVSDDGTTITYPKSGQIVIENVIIGAYVLVGRDSGTDIDLSEYTLDGAVTSGGSTCKVAEAIKNDTADAGYIRVANVPYEYSAVNRATKTFTIVGTFGQAHVSGSATWCPFIDRIATATTESSIGFIYDADFTARVKVRKGASPSSVQPAEATFTVGSGTSAYGVILNDDE